MLNGFVLYIFQTDTIPYMMRVDRKEGEPDYEGFLVDLLEQLSKDVGFQEPMLSNFLCR